ncbi:unnamed protein product [Hymenolepis diminuta]|uniref:Uncharacterized protein n=1 Tax=Hymenolepis diminuta TaxID=6216 RepID=A0A564ZF60_HYMDI|nr:unnamed protein product [Hymenolepis diminuta]
MVSRAYLESKSTSSFCRIPGVNLPEEQIFFIMLIQTICTKPSFLDFGLTEVCESTLKAIQLSPTFMSLAVCSPTRYVTLNLTNSPDSPITRILPSDCFP